MSIFQVYRNSHCARVIADEAANANVLFCAGRGHLVDDGTLDTLFNHTGARQNFPVPRCGQDLEPKNVAASN